MPRWNCICTLGHAYPPLASEHNWPIKTYEGHRGTRDQLLRSLSPPPLPAAIPAQRNSLHPAECPRSPAWSKGNKTDPATYRPICCIKTLVKPPAVWQCEQLTPLTQQHRLIHPCQHRGLKKHRCGDHIYDVVPRKLRSKGVLYHLYIVLDKAFNSVPLRALCTGLRGYGLAEALMSSIQPLYDNATDQPLMNWPQRRNIHNGVGSDKDVL